jgi:hypothetical protein
VSDPAWKKTERKIARFFGAERNVGSGGATPSNRSDSTHPTLHIETKHGAGCPKGWGGIVELFEKVEALAEKEGKRPLLVLHAKGMNRVEFYDAYLRLHVVDRRIGDPVVCVPLVEARRILDLEPVF